MKEKAGTPIALSKNCLRLLEAARLRYEKKETKVLKERTEFIALGTGGPAELLRSRKAYAHHEGLRPESLTF